MKQAVIDLGTNTFHLMITDGGQTLFRESRPAKIGKAGINQGIITEEATERALVVLRYFRDVLNQHQVPVEQAVAIGTSAIRNAGNQTEFIDRVRQETGIRIRSISGDEEAGYIYAGVRAAGTLDDQMALVVDIGGGSVEFILCTQQRIYWKQSFEIGGQRLLERFMETDPISPSAVSRMNRYFQEQLLPLTNAIHQYPPVALVGSSGSFDTLIDMLFVQEKGHWPAEDQTASELPLDAFYRFYELLLTRNHDERMQLPGMIELRVDMIVVGVCLIDYLLRTYGIRQIRVSTYSLKEGVLADGLPDKNGSV
ncbi:exopolyphosphatase/guanosine-5'-triphosphate,3'-diphosphate pyrophosphatase [Larkinella arboricola]|uniref:Exopolyphosphatase/guanosine-5'-triphosphate, 3'-diphosphate pyrophosphatase n=1 Tax=Larkinella arboricola TaxID=643671 RepID=A0A327XAE5_LARAB|nr:phosphatase [Larkinella arboricola]RAK03228.1 exopolyphosphatase/guanosine-5'-triphosphate,3'-diphosphate pyrophosphatase [Larkinella arboricola]